MDNFLVKQRGKWYNNVEGRILKGSIDLCKETETENKSVGDLCRDETVSTSKWESVQKAVELMNAHPQMERPTIQWRQILLCNLLWFAVVAAVFCLTELLPLGVVGARVLITLLAALVISLFHARRIVICLVRIYQRYAPEGLRAACVYEPSCSQYMILAVKKYGALRGVWKGIRRLLRCHPPNAGTDYP